MDPLHTFCTIIFKAERCKSISFNNEKTIFFIKLLPMFKKKIHNKVIITHWSDIFFIAENIADQYLKEYILKNSVNSVNFLIYFNLRISRAKYYKMIKIRKNFFLLRKIILLKERSLVHTWQEWMLKHDIKTSETADWLDAITRVINMTTICRHQGTFNQSTVHAFPFILWCALIAIQGNCLIN